MPYDGLKAMIRRNGTTASSISKTIAASREGPDIQGPGDQRQLEYTVAAAGLERAVYV